MTTALYRHFDAKGELLYVGISLRVLARLGQHACNSHWFAQIVRVEISHYPTREDAVAAERVAILVENPSHNIQGKAKKEVDKEQRDAMRAAQSKQRLLARYVEFQISYSLKEIVVLTGLSASAVDEAIGKNTLGTYWAKNKAGYEHPRVTGWALIDFLEYLEAR